MPVSALAIAGGATNAASAARMHTRPRQSIVSARRVGLLGVDIDHLTVTATERKPCLTAGDLGAERKAPDATLELIRNAKATAPVRSRRPERLPAATVMHEQVHDRAL